MIEGLKVVTAHEMARIEGLAYAKGALEVEYMENAGKAIADCVERFADQCGLDREVTLIVGKGNNGGDAYAAGRKLKEKGFNVIAYHIYSIENCGPLCQKMCEAFRSQGGVIYSLHSEDHFPFKPKGIILDGLVGTGFRGAAEGILAKMIQAANQSKLPILAIDIPSGVCGNTGNVVTVAIQATITISLGLPKLGLFIADAWNHVGELVHASFGLSQESVDAAKPFAYLIKLDSLDSLLPKIRRTRHKYEAGYVLGIAGSPGMPGAALLSSTAVLKSGAGIIRLFHPYGMEDELCSAPYEVIREGWDCHTLTRLQEEMTRAKALFVGPGIGRGKEAKQMMKRLLPHIHIPSVLDADALFFLAEQPSLKLPEKSILTPHRKEMKALLSTPIKEEDFLSSCQTYVDDKETTLVLKGAPTWVFAPRERPLIMTAGDPGMATAGSGDVLTGIIAAMLAQGLDPIEAAVLGTALHGFAGEHAASDLTSYCMTASDLTTYLPEAFQDILADRGCQKS